MVDSRGQLHQKMPAFASILWGCPWQSHLETLFDIRGDVTVSFGKIGALLNVKKFKMTIEESDPFYSGQNTANWHLSSGLTIV
jgi:hypothetical protein